ncbi:MAG TPA: GNAT family N-acetyltransferase [Chitinophagaceae bacterium]|nr:GNAT family N-acetyltransferase [Chitinophagaceae bacterium]
MRSILVIVSKDSWGKGYATEAAYASIWYGFEKMGCSV